MTEKINGQGLRPTDTAGLGARTPPSRRAARGRSRTATADPSASASDTVTITQSGLLLSKLEELVQNSPVVDQQRVTEIKDALAAGTYEIDDQRVADRLLKFERDVLG